VGPIGQSVLVDALHGAEKREKCRRRRDPRAPAVTDAPSDDGLEPAKSGVQACKRWLGDPTMNPLTCCRHRDASAVRGRAVRAGVSTGRARGREVHRVSATSRVRGAVPTEGGRSSVGPRAV